MNVPHPAVDLYLGISGSIRIPVYLGNPETGISCKKDGKVLDTRFTNGTELVFPTVESSHAGTYNCSLDTAYPVKVDTPYLIINVRVKSMCLCMSIIKCVY